MVFDQIYVTYSILEGNIVTLTGKIVRGQVGSFALIDRVKRRYEHISCENLAMDSVSGCEETPKTAELATVGMSGVSQGPKL